MGLACVAVGVAATLGGVGKLAPNSHAIATALSGLLLILTGGCALDGRLHRSCGCHAASWLVLALAASLSLAVRSAAMQRTSIAAEHRTTRFGWAMLGAPARSDLQRQFACCGYADHHDSPELPCASASLTGCSGALLTAIRARGATLATVATVALVVEALFACGALLIAVPLGATRLRRALADFANRRGGRYKRVPSAEGGEI